MAGLSVKGLWLVGLLFVLPGCPAAGPEKTPDFVDAYAQHDALDLPASALVFEPAELDMGQVREGEKAVAHILIRNSGSSMESIVSMQTSCGCSVVEPGQHLLQPGGFTRATITIDTFAKQDDVKKWVELTDGQGRRSRAILHLKVLPNPHLKTGGRSIFDGQCATCHVKPAEGKTSGPAVYQAVCSMCHGAQAEGAYAPSLRRFRDMDALSALIGHGTGSRYMPGFARRQGGPLDDAQIRALAAWLLTLDD